MSGVHHLSLVPSNTRPGTESTLPGASVVADSSGGLEWYREVGDRTGTGCPAEQPG